MTKTGYIVVAMNVGNPYALGDPIIMLESLNAAKAFAEDLADAYQDGTVVVSSKGVVDYGDHDELVPICEYEWLEAQLGIIR